MKTLKITKIYRNTKDKEGNDLKTHDGRNYERVAIKTEEYGDKYISGFGNSRNKSWNIGDEVELEVEQSGEYLNFRMQPLAVKYKEFLDLRDRVLNLESRVAQLEGEDIGKKDASEKVFEDEPQAQDEEVPF